MTVVHFAYARSVVLNLNVPAEVHRRLEATAAARGMSVEEFAGEVLAAHPPGGEVAPVRRYLSIVGIGASKEGISHQVDGLLADGFGR
ncbi:hypothetical protein BH10ACT2_BH10ACT2_25330 [soil metagenome]